MLFFLLLISLFKVDVKWYWCYCLVFIWVLRRWMMKFFVIGSLPLCLGFYGKIQRGNEIWVFPSYQMPELSLWIVQFSLVLSCWLNVCMHRQDNLTALFRLCLFSCLYLFCSVLVLSGFMQVTQAIISFWSFFLPH